MSEDRNSNIGQVGVESIRIKGQRIDDLPLGLGNAAKAQLPAAIEQERLNNISTINASYPTHRIDYLISRINECEENKKRMLVTTAQLNTMTSEYKGQIEMCKHRDREIERVKSYNMDDTFPCGELSQSQLDEIKELEKNFPLYDVAAMEQQIIQNGEGIERCNGVIADENNSIKEFTEVLTLCRERDKRLAEYGAKAEGS